jgi:hypothetical protein
MSESRESGPLHPELPEVVADRGGANTGDGTDSGKAEGMDDRGGTTTGNGAEGSTSDGTGEGDVDDSDNGESAGVAGSARSGCTGGTAGSKEGNVSPRETPGVRARSWFSTPRTRSGATGSHPDGTSALRAAAVSIRMFSLSSITMPTGPAKLLRSL